MLGLAPSRGSKSTGIARLIRLTTLFDNYEDGMRTLNEADRYLVIQDWSRNHCIYKARQTFIDIIKDEYAPNVVSDDALLMGDKRRSMEGMEVFLTQAIERFAKNNPRIYTNWQNVTYLDPRFMDGANIALDYDQRGHVYIYAKEKSALYQTSFGFERFKKHPKLANDAGRTSLSSFCYQYYFDELDGNVFWDNWEKNKDAQI